MHSGNEYGTSYTAPGGAKSLNATRPELNLCGKYSTFNPFKFTGHIRAFGFYTNAFSVTDAMDNCLIASLTSCTTFDPTPSPSKSPTMPTKQPTSTPTSSPTSNPVPTYNPTMNPTGKCSAPDEYLVNGNSAVASGDPHFV